jgi:hypothetical protein
MNNELTYDVYDTLLRKSELPEKLQNIPKEYVRPNIVQLCNNITTFNGVVLLSGLKRGKTSNAAVILLSYLNACRGFTDTQDIGLYVSVNQLCYQNRTQDRFNRDNEVQMMVRRAVNARCLILDGLFSYLTQLDDLMLQAIYDARQNKSCITVVTTSMTDPLNCAGSVMYRIARDAKVKEVF